MREHQVTALGGVTGDVPEGPHALLADLLRWAREELDQDRHRAVVNNMLHVLRGARGDVGECPGRLKLERRVIVALEKLDEPRASPRVDHLLGMPVVLCTSKRMNCFGAILKIFMWIKNWYNEQ